MNNYRKALIGAASVLATTGTTAQATSCWSGVQEAAAKVRNLQVRLMDATFRCQAAGIDITPAYNNFINVNRSTLQGANAVLRERLGEAEYDRFVTSLANGVLTGGTGADTCAAAAALATEGSAAAGAIQALVELERRMEVTPALPGGTCPMTFTIASAETAIGGSQ